MSRVRADQYTNSNANGAPLFPDGLRVSGVVTTGSVTATSGSFSGDVSVGGTITYEDVTNVDSVGVVTARLGVNVTGGEIAVGAAFSVGQAGVVTATSFSGDGSSLTGIQAGSSNFVASGAIPIGRPVVINDDGTVGVVTASGPATDSVGVKTTFTANASNTRAAFDSTNGKVVIAFEDGGNSSYGTAIVGTVSGTSISFGSEAVFESAATSQCAAVYDSANGKVVIGYRDDGNSYYGTAVVGTVSGTSISFGSATVFESANCNPIKGVYDSANGKVVFAYQDGGNSAYGTAVVGTVSGTGISFGTPVVFESAGVEHVAATFDSTAGVNKVVIAYQDGGNSNYGTAIVGTVSGTSISFGDPLVYNSANSTETGITHDSTNGKVVIVYKDGAPGTASVFTTNGIVTTLTSENYIGISAEAISDGETGKIDIVSGINTSQSGLTTARTLYVTITGDISTVADTPSVIAGTSISATKIIVKG